MTRAEMQFCRLGTEYYIAGRSTLFLKLVRIYGNIYHHAIVFRWIFLEINNKLRKFLPWTRLRSLSNSTAVKLTVFIPLIGYIVLFNSYVVDYLALSRHLFSSGDTISNISWRLIFIYFGLIFLAIGSAIYQFFCPVEIKQFATSADYIAATWPHMGDLMRGRLESDLKQNPNSSEEFTVMQSVINERIQRYMDYHEREQRERLRGDFYRDILELNFRTMNET